MPALILQPIVENAVKYGVAGAPPPATIGIGARQVDGQLLLEVVDSGKGKPAESGGGIGLANVEQRLTLLYGEDRSSLTAGRIPTAASGSACSAVGGCMNPLRVLTVDDEMLALKRLKLLLQTIPQAEHVGEAASCAEALAKINQLRPDVLLLDIKMRDGNGFDVVEAIAQRSNPPLVIFVTAFDQYAAQAFDSAVADYLLKPVERERLVRALVRAERQLHAMDAEQRVDELHQVLRNLGPHARGRGAGVRDRILAAWLDRAGACPGRCHRLRQQRRRICRDPHRLGIAFDARVDPPVCRAGRARPFRARPPSLAGPAQRD